MKKSIVQITDHALLRYLERLEGVDVEGLRRRLGREIDAHLIDELPDPCGVTVNGIRWRLRGKHVVTCIKTMRRRER